MKIDRRWTQDRMMWFHLVLDTLLATGASQALKYVSPTEVITATRLTYRGAKARKFAAGRRLEVRLTVDRPNYLARRFVKACIKAGEPFPVMKIQLRYPPKPRK